MSLGDFFLFSIIMTHFNFIEIGTSDFGTLIQYCNDNDIGLSVEPLQFYLDKLPNKKNVKKINAAISNNNSSIDIYYVEPDTIIKSNLPWFIKGCNSIGQPHPVTKHHIKVLGLDEAEIVKKQHVIVKDIQTLFTENDVESIDHLKIDTEGHDCIILQNYLDYCNKHTNLFAKKITFEANFLTKKEDQDIIINQFYDVGYSLESRTDVDVTLIKNK
jgi:hypothetical protein